MSHPCRPPAILLLTVAAIAAAPGPLEDEPDGYALLQAMPRERRVTLSENLQRFDKLAPAEQAAIRKLDAEIRRKDPVEQVRYRALIRRYHLWVNGLTDDQKKALQEAGSDEARFNLARKFRLKEMEGTPSGPRLYGIRTGDYGLIGPFEAAHLLKVWNKLTPAKQAEIAKHRERSTLIADIRAQTKATGVPFHPFPQAEEKVYDAKLDPDKEFKEVLGSYAKRVDMIPKKAAEAAHAKGEAVPKRFEQRFTESLYFEDHKPKPVSQKNLERFSASCPDWLRSTVDSLSPDDARNYLTILYRLLYPEPSEMPDATKAAKPSTTGTAPSTPKSSPRKSGPPGPL